MTTMLTKTTINMAERRGLTMINRIETIERLCVRLKTRDEQVEVLDIGTEDTDAMVLYYRTSDGYRYLASTLDDADFPLTIANEAALREMLPDLQRMLAG
jgi:hypothetical protein